MPAWITPLLCVLVSMPGRGCRSRTQTEAPVAAIARAEARPVTPAPMTATSMCVRVRGSAGRHRRCRLLPEFQFVNRPEQRVGGAELPQPDDPRLIVRQHDVDGRIAVVGGESAAELRQHRSLKQRARAAGVDDVDRQLARIVAETPFGRLHPHDADVARRSRAPARSTPRRSGAGRSASACRDRRRTAAAAGRPRARRARESRTRRSSGRRPRAARRRSSAGA